MESLREFLDSTASKWHTRKISDEHKVYLKTLYPSYDLKMQIHLFLGGFDKEPSCVICGGKLKKITAITCSRECRNKHLRDPLVQQQAKDKQKKTLMERYGVENASQSSTFQKKRLDTMQRRHGDVVSTKTREKAKERASELNAKAKETLRKRYGVENSAQIDGHYEKCRSTMLRNSGVTHYTHSEEYKAQRDEVMKAKWNSFSDSSVAVFGLKKIEIDGCDNPNDRVQFECECGNVEIIPSETFKWRVNNVGTPCSKCSELNHGSKAERDIAVFLEQHTEVVRNTRDVISPSELDIYLPDHNIAIEYNGLYWHSELYKDNNYHLNKTVACEEKDIRLIHIFEDEYLDNPDIVKSRLLTAIGQVDTRVYARKCVVREIPPTISNAFINDNHIQGSGRANVHLGLYHDNELVSVMTFLRGDISKKVEGWELNRFCSRLNTLVVGGASRLFKHFVKNYSPSKITSFADRRWSNTTPFYGQLGFKMVGHTRPNYWYMEPSCGKRLHRYGLRKPQGCEVTERELRETQGYLRIYDCGSARYEWG